MASKLLTSNIPLNCNICPKKPDFSDVSHLLTHIASKSHLSNYYKCKVKATNEDASKKLIQDYDLWYATWDIETLMSERLNLKEQKFKSRAGAAMAAPAPHYRPAHPLYPQFMGAGYYQPSVDPRLMPPIIKTEPSSGSATPMHAPVATTFTGFANPYAHAMPPPFMHMSAAQDEADETSSQASFVPGRRTKAKANNDATSVDNADDDAKSIADINKLKGVFWPGMDLFDSATPDQRRKRNQKKDTSVVQQLEATSKLVEASENIFTPGGTFCRTRPISGLPDFHGGALPGEESPPRPKATRKPRKALAGKDGNLPIQPAKKPAKRGRPRGSKANAAVAQSPAMEVEDAYVAAPPAKPRKRGKKAVSVYRDEEVTLEQPAEMNTLTSGFRPESQRAEPRAAASLSYRPEEPAYIAQQAYYPHYGYYPNPFALEPVLPPWDYYAQDTSGTFYNPLYMGPDPGSFDVDDDQQTISVPGSDQ